jgi:hypothetical protein
MKRILFAAIAALQVLSLGAPLARADDSEQIEFDGTKYSIGVQLNDQEKHTLYQTVAVQSTCYKQELVGYQTVCHTQWQNQCHWQNHQVCRPVTQCNNLPPPQQTCWTQTVCHNEQQYVCHQVPHQVCHQEPQYATVPYPCTQYVEKPVGEELDFNVKADLTLNFNRLDQSTPAPERFQSTLSGERLVVSLLQDSKQFLLYLNQASSNVKIIKPDQGAQSPGEKLVTAVYDVKRVPVAEVVSPIQGEIANIAMQGSQLSYEGGKVFDPASMSLHVTIKRDKFGSDPTVVDADIPSSQLVIQDAGQGRSKVFVPLEKFLQEKLREANYHVTLTVSLVRGSTQGLLNPALLPSVTEKEGKTKIAYKP